MASYAFLFMLRLGNPKSIFHTHLPLDQPHLECPRASCGLQLVGVTAHPGVWINQTLSQRAKKEYFSWSFPSHDIKGQDCRKPKFLTSLRDLEMIQMPLQRRMDKRTVVHAND